MENDGSFLPKITLKHDILYMVAEDYDIFFPVKNEKLSFLTKFTKTWLFLHYRLS